MIDLMDADPFLSPKLKIERAERHIHEFHAAAKAFWNTNPYKIVTETDAQAGQLIYKLKILKPIPPTFSLIIGDAIQNLRASLDHAACCLAIQNNPTVNINSVSFPIERDIAEFETRRVKDKIKKLSPKARAFIKALKPYKGGNDTFWRLHRLSVRDRHRLLIATWGAYAATGHQFGIMDPRTGEQLVSTVFIEPVVNYFEPLEDGAELGREPIPSEPAPTTFGPENIQIKNNTTFRLQIAFGDGEVVIAEPVSPTLLQLREFVKDVVTKIETRFFL